MKKLDLRTAIVMLAIFAVGYATCAVLQPSPALALGDRLEVEELIADRIIANESIQSGGTIGASQSITAGVEIKANSIYADCFIAETVLHLAPTCYLEGQIREGIISSSTRGGLGLDVGKLGGHPAHDYVLWSDLEPRKVWLPYVVR